MSSIKQKIKIHPPTKLIISKKQESFDQDDNQIINNIINLKSNLNKLSEKSRTLKKNSKNVKSLDQITPFLNFYSGGPKTSVHQETEQDWEKYYEQNIEKIVKMQAFFRGGIQRKKFRLLTNEHNIQKIQNLQFHIKHGSVKNELI